jgi:hypothetical protein
VSVFETAACTKPRARRHRRATLNVGEAETLGPHDLAVDCDGNREARQIFLHEQRARLLAFSIAPEYRSAGATATVDGTAAGSL